MCEVLTARWSAAVNIPILQAEIFDRVGVPIVDQALKGYNGSIFA